MFRQFFIPIPTLLIIGFTAGLVVGCSEREAAKSGQNVGVGGDPGTSLKTSTTKATTVIPASTGGFGTAGTTATGGTSATSGTSATGGTSTTSGTSATSGTTAINTDPTAAWVMSYFGPNQDLSSDSLHLAYSTDGLHWTSLNAGEPVYQAPTTIQGIAGSGHIRDPYILRKNDGTFVYLATDWTLAVNDSTYWNHPSSRIFVADSADLITFTNPRFLKLVDQLGSTAQPHAWAPEAYYDASRDQYAIVWSGNDERNRTYVSYTKDFVQLVSDTPEVLFDPGYDEIDATVTQGEGSTYLFYKDERSSGKDIQVAKSSGMTLSPGAFNPISSSYLTRGTNQSTSQGTEGPLVIRIPGQNRWYLYADFYGKGGVFGCWTTTDLDADPATWTKLDNGTDFSLPSGVRHANTVRVTQPQLDALKKHYKVSLLKTTYSENDVPFYVAHSWYHAMITTLDDTNNGQLPADFYWRTVPGLADPTDESLISFESVAYPGYYLRIDSASATRWPTGNSATAANRGDGLTLFAAEDQTNLVWLDPYVNSSVYKSDATFRKAQALNGDPNSTSFQVHGNTALYLRHINYQVQATSVSSSQQKVDASFLIEAR